MNVPEHELLELRARVAKLYGEDAAQDTVVRVLSKDYHDRWFEWELRNARRHWLKSRREELRLLLMEEVHEPRYQDESRIDARGELRKILTIPVGVSLALHESGRKKVDSGYLARIRRAIRRHRL